MESSHEGHRPRAWITQRLDDLLWRRDFDSAEFLTASIAVVWGLWLLNPLWTTYTVSPSYAALALLVPEEVLGTGMVIVAISQIIALIFDARAWRRVTALAMAGAWTFAGISFLWSNVPDSSGPTYVLLALAETWAFLRLGRMHRT